MALIRLTNLSKRFESEADCVEAVRSIDLEIAAGSFAGIFGASGSGKSTLLTMLGGLAQPSDGTVEIDGIDIYRLPGERLADFRREYIGFVFQSFNLVDYLNALENVMLPLAVIKLPVARKRELAENALRRVGLAHRLYHLPSQLSGGEQERVAIARALVNSPPVILADEPTGSLDAETGREIMELFRELNREGQTIVMVTHNFEHLSSFNRVIHLRDGAVETDETDGETRKLAG